MPTAWKGCRVPMGRVAPAGVTWIDVSVAALTVRLADPLTPMYVALMVAVPGARPVTGPRPAPLLTSAPVMSDAVQAAGGPPVPVLPVSENGLASEAGCWAAVRPAVTGVAA